jgi:hypothetical protein
LLHCDYLTFNRGSLVAGRDTPCGIQGGLRAFDAVEHQGQCLWRLPFIVAQRNPALGHGIAAYKPIEVELLYNGVGLDVLGIGYERFPEGLRKKVVDQYPRVNFKQEIAIQYKPGEVRRPPPWNIPHQPRLDWQMWFAALGAASQNPWFLRFLQRLLED